MLVLVLSDWPMMESFCKLYGFYFFAFDNDDLNFQLVNDWKIVFDSQSLYCFDTFK